MMTTCFPNAFTNCTPGNFAPGCSPFTGSYGYPPNFSQPFGGNGFQPNYGAWNTQSFVNSNPWYTQPYSQQFNSQFAQPFWGYGSPTNAAMWSWYQNCFNCDPSTCGCPTGSSSNWGAYPGMWNSNSYGAFNAPSFYGQGFTPGAYNWNGGYVPSYTNGFSPMNSAFPGCSTGSVFPYAWNNPGYAWNPGFTSPSNYFSSPFAQYATPYACGTPSYGFPGMYSNYPCSNFAQNWNSTPVAGYPFNTQSGSGGYNGPNLWSAQGNDAARYQNTAPNGTMNLKRDAA